MFLFILHACAPFPLASTTLFITPLSILPSFHLQEGKDGEEELQSSNPHRQATASRSVDVPGPKLPIQTDVQDSCRPHIWTRMSTASFRRCLSTPQLSTSTSTKAVELKAETSAQNRQQSGPEERRGVCVCVLVVRPH